jgi:hypothetical protein
VSIRSIVKGIADRIRGEKKTPPPEGGGISPPGDPPYRDRPTLEPRFSEIREATPEPEPTPETEPTPELVRDAEGRPQTPVVRPVPPPPPDRK